MKTLVALAIAFLTGVASVPKPAVTEQAPRFLSEQEDEYLRRLCQGPGCVIMPKPIANELQLRASKCRA